ncbi:unnamed protein product [Haemonchus placei]|uniref:ULD domain-containing protein n=1 Tax=Haemonchus placei TaxID=6290 RepID=A0A0N4WUK1_HAEPC|nr:unnamed protein product [Haemonchus placei]
MFPVRVAVETVRAQHCLSCAHDGHILVDTYAIVSGTTVLSQLVETVLSALGHPQLALNARGKMSLICLDVISFLFFPSPIHSLF